MHVSCIANVVYMYLGTHRRHPQMARVAPPARYIYIYVYIYIYIYSYNNVYACIMYSKCSIYFPGNASASSTINESRASCYNVNARIIYSSCSIYIYLIKKQRRRQRARAAPPAIM